MANVQDYGNFTVPVNESPAYRPLHAEDPNIPSATGLWLKSFGQVSDVALKFQEQADNARVGDLRTQFYKQAIDLQKGENGWEKLEGYDALAPDQNGDSLVQRNDKALAEAKSSLEAQLPQRLRKSFSDQVQPIIRQQYGLASQHVFTQSNKYYDSVDTNAEALAIQSAGLYAGDTGMTDSAYQDLVNAAGSYARRHGLAPEAAEAHMKAKTGEFVRTGAAAILADLYRDPSAPARAEALFSQYSDKMDIDSLLKVRKANDDAWDYQNLQVDTEAAVNALTDPVRFLNVSSSGASSTPAASGAPAAPSAASEVALTVPQQRGVYTAADLKAFTPWLEKLKAASPNLTIGSLDFFLDTGIKGAESSTVLSDSAGKLRGAYSNGTKPPPESQGRGLYQVIPSTAKELCKKHGIEYSEDRLNKDDAYNRQLARLRLEDALRYFKGDVLKAAVAYNQGEGTVDRAVRAAKAQGRTDWINATDSKGNMIIGPDGRSHYAHFLMYSRIAEDYLKGKTSVAATEAASTPAATETAAGASALAAGAEAGAGASASVAASTPAPALGEPTTPFLSGYAGQAAARKAYATHEEVERWVDANSPRAQGDSHYRDKLVDSIEKKLGRRKQDDAQTQQNIFDLTKNAIDEGKNPALLYGQLTPDNQRTIDTYREAREEEAAGMVGNGVYRQGSESAKIADYYLFGPDAEKHLLAVDQKTLREHTRFMYAADRNAVLRSWLTLHQAAQRAGDAKSGNVYPEYLPTTSSIERVLRSGVFKGREDVQEILEDPRKLRNFVMTAQWQLGQENQLQGKKPGEVTALMERRIYDLLIDNLRIRGASKGLNLGAFTADQLPNDSITDAYSVVNQLALPITSARLGHAFTGEITGELRDDAMRSILNCDVAWRSTPLVKGTLAALDEGIIQEIRKEYNAGKPLDPHVEITLYLAKLLQPESDRPNASADPKAAATVDSVVVNPDLAWD